MIGAMRRNRFLKVAVVAAAFVALGAMATWPMATDLHRQSLAGPYNTDFHFNTFVVMWGAKAVTSDPLGLHHTNMFWPERYTFAYSDMELSHSLLVLPLLAWRYEPLLAINVLLLASMAIGGTGAFLLARRLTGSDAAAFAGALVFVFNDAHFARILQIQFFGDHWAPWLALALLWWLDTLSWKRAMLASGAFLLHVLSGSHASVFAALITVTVVGATALRRGLLWDRRLWVGVAAFAVLAALVLVPLFYPYLLLQDRMAAERGDNANIMAEGNARLLDLLSGNSRLHRWIDERFGWPSAVFEGRLRAHLFPGWVPLLLASLALLPAAAAVGADRRGERLTWVLLWLLCLWLALGPPAGLYRLLAMAPGVRLIRVASRFVLPSLLGLSMLSAFGVARLLPRLRPSARLPLLLLLLVAFSAESAYAPMPTDTREPGPDAIASWLAERPGDFAVLELPVDPQNLTVHMRQVTQSLYHGKRLLVGYSGWRSKDVESRLWRLQQSFPARRALDELAELGVRFVVALDGRVPGDTLEAMRGSRRLQQVATVDGASIWELDGERWR